MDYGLISFGGADASLAPDPALATNTVARVVRAAGAASYAGTTITAAAGLGFSSPVPFSATDTTMSVRVWSPAVDIPARLKVEDHADATHSVETEATTTVAGAWETLTFDFAHQATGTAGLDLAYRYDKASVFFDFNRDDYGPRLLTLPPLRTGLRRVAAFSTDGPRCPAADGGGHGGVDAHVADASRRPEKCGGIGPSGSG